MLAPQRSGAQPVPLAVVVGALKLASGPPASTSTANLQHPSGLAAESPWVHCDLDYMHARFHSPVTGRFLSVDPEEGSADLRLPQSWNRYSYVTNNPVNYTDPTGRFGLPLALLALSLCSEQGLCSNEIVHVKESFTTGLEGLAELERGGYGDYFAASVEALPGRLAKSLGDMLFPIDREGLHAQYQRVMQYESLAECVEAGDCTVAMVPLGPGGLTGSLSRKAGDLISGTLKRSPSYRSELADKTYAEILKLARGKGPQTQAARQMKKLIESSKRLLEEQGGKPR